MTSLSNNRKLFCQEYLKLGMNGTQAYLNVYKACKKEAAARTNASRLLTNTNIQEYIKELQSKVQDKTIVSIEDIVKELSVIAFGDRTELAQVESKDVVDDETKKVLGKQIYLNVTATDKLSDNAKKIISGYKKTRSGISVETCDKVKALELLGKYLGMFTETVKIENPEATKILSSISRQLGGKSE